MLAQAHGPARAMTREAAPRWSSTRTPVTVRQHSNGRQTRSTTPSRVFHQIFLAPSDAVELAPPRRLQLLLAHLPGARTSRNSPSRAPSLAARGRCGCGPERLRRRSWWGRKNLELWGPEQVRGITRGHSRRRNGGTSGRQRRRNAGGVYPAPPRPGRCYPGAGPVHAMVRPRRIAMMSPSQDCRPPGELNRGSASRPSTNARARRRGSTRRNRAPARVISSSNIPSQRPGPTLWPAATARSSRVVTNRMIRLWSPCLQHRHAADRDPAGNRRSQAG